MQGARELGPLITVSQSAHIYDDCWENADALIRDRYAKAAPTYDDPNGNFTVEWQEHPQKGWVIAVTQCSPLGSPTRVWTGKNPTFLTRKIMAECPGLWVEHAAYLGGEIARAAILRDEFRQDLINSVE